MPCCVCWTLVTSVDSSLLVCGAPWWASWCASLCVCWLSWGNSSCFAVCLPCCPLGSSCVWVLVCSVCGPWVSLYLFVVVLWTLCWGSSDTLDPFSGAPGPGSRNPGVVTGPVLVPCYSVVVGPVPEPFGLRPCDLYLSPDPDLYLDPDPTCLGPGTGPDRSRNLYSVSGSVHDRTARPTDHQTEYEDYTHRLMQTPNQTEKDRKKLEKMERTPDSKTDNSYLTQSVSFCLILTVCSSHSVLLTISLSLNVFFPNSFKLTI